MPKLRYPNTTKFQYELYTLLSAVILFLSLVHKKPKKIFHYAPDDKKNSTVFFVFSHYGETPQKLSKVVKVLMLAVWLFVFS